MGTTLNKLEYLDETKGQIKTALNQFNAQITDETTFRDYVDKINDIYNNWEKVTGEGTEVTLTPTLKGKLGITPAGNTEQESTNGYQLLGIPNFTETKGGLTLKVENGLITINGTSTSGVYFYVPIEDITLNTTVKFSLSISDSTTIPSGVGRYLTDTDKNLIRWSYGMAGLADNTNFSPTTNTIAKYLHIAVNNTGTTFNNFQTKIMFEKGATSHEWEQFTGNSPSPSPSYPQNIRVVTGNNTVVVRNSDNTQSQTLPLNLGNIELNKISTYQDYIYKNNGKWYKKEYIGKHTFTNSDTIGYQNGFGTINIGTSTMVGSVTQKMLSNCFIDYGNVGELGSKENSMYNNSTIIYFHNSSVTSDSAWKTFLVEHNTIVYYAKAIPTDIEITDTSLIEQLEEINKMKSYEGTTIITSTYTEGNAQMIISASALKKGSE